MSIRDNQPHPVLGREKSILPRPGDRIRSRRCAPSGCSRPARCSVAKRSHHSCSARRAASYLEASESEWKLELTSSTA